MRALVQGTDEALELALRARGLKLVREGPAVDGEEACAQDA